MCIARGPDIGYYSLHYSRSFGPISAIKSEDESDRTLVNPDIVLASQTPPEASGPPSYRIDISCQIPGAAPEQKDQVLVSGWVIDDLTGQRNTRMSYTHLLHSARVMVKALGCTNKPVVPAQPPASVK